MLGVPVSTAGMVYHQLFGVGLDAGHDSYMCRIVYVDASGFFLVLSVVSCSCSRALTCQEGKKHPQGTFWKGAAAMGGGL